jgi:hypothetical protein
LDLVYLPILAVKILTARASMKTKLEIVWCPDGTAFLNFWDTVHGKDVCCQIDTGGKLIDENGEGKEITFAEFISMVESVVAPFTEQTNQPDSGE